MALTPSKSAQFTDFSAAPKVMVKPTDWGAGLVQFFSKLVHTAAGTGTAQMIKLPPGRLRILPDLSRIVCPVGTATADLHVGHAAHTDMAGAAVAADDNSLADNLDVGGAALDQALTLPTNGSLELNSRDGIDIEVMIDTANGPAAGDMELTLVVAILP